MSDEDIINIKMALIFGDITLEEATEMLRKQLKITKPPELGKPNND